LYSDKIGCVWAGSQPIESWQLVTAFCKIFVDGMATPFGPKAMAEIMILRHARFITVTLVLSAVTVVSDTLRRRYIITS